MCSRMKKSLFPRVLWCIVQWERNLFCSKDPLCAHALRSRLSKRSWERLSGLTFTLFTDLKLMNWILFSHSVWKSPPLSTATARFRVPSSFWKIAQLAFVNRRETRNSAQLLSWRSFNHHCYRCINSWFHKMVWVVARASPNLQLFVSVPQ